MNAALRCLEEGDAAGLGRLWRRLYPQLPQPRDGAQEAFVLHRARTSAESVSLAKRLYSHAWLEERGLPSDLPDALRPVRRDSRIVAAVGIAVMPRTPARADLARAIEAAMAAAAAEAMADGIEDPRRISALMWAARDRVMRMD